MCVFVGVCTLACVQIVHKFPSASRFLISAAHEKPQTPTTMAARITTATKTARVCIYIPHIFIYGRFLSPFKARFYINVYIIAGPTSGLWGCTYVVFVGHHPCFKPTWMWLLFMGINKVSCGVPQINVLFLVW